MISSRSSSVQSCGTTSRTTECSNVATGGEPHRHADIGDHRDVIQDLGVVRIGRHIGHHQGAPCFGDFTAQGWPDNVRRSRRRSTSEKQRSTCRSSLIDVITAIGAFRARRARSVVRCSASGEAHAHRSSEFTTATAFHRRPCAVRRYGSCLNRATETHKRIKTISKSIFENCVALCIFISTR